MDFLNASTPARIAFAQKIKTLCCDPRKLTINAEFDLEEKSVFVYGLDKNDDVLAVQSFPLNPRAWNKTMKSEIEKQFRGSAIIYRRGR